MVSFSSEIGKSRVHDKMCQLAPITKQLLVYLQVPYAFYKILITYKKKKKKERKKERRRR
jgi:hypothetical protein